MHKLNRSRVPVPACLDAPPAERRYASLSGTEKEEIRAALFKMQGGSLCAYCERRTIPDPRARSPWDGHIEHFRKQADHGHMDLLWKNLFWSCLDEATCGKRKDKCDKHDGPFKKFAENDLIDPACEDPEAFLLFLSDGSLQPRDGLSPADKHRAEETIRIFGLSNSPFLRKLREDAVRPYLGILDALRIAGPVLFLAYTQGELQRLDTVPFATPIKQFLESVQL